MKKKVIVTSIIGFILMAGGIALWLFIGNLLGSTTLTFEGFYLPLITNIGGTLAAAYNPLGTATIIMLAVCGLMLILWLVQLVLIIKKKRGPAVVLLIVFLLEIAITYAALSLFVTPGNPGGLPAISLGFGPIEWILGQNSPAGGAAVTFLQLMLYFLPALLFVIGWIVALVGLISDLVFLSGLPRPRRKGAPCEDEVMVVNEGEEPTPAEAEKALAAKEGAGQEIQGPAPVPAAAGIQGPLLVQYINTYSPGEPARKAGGVPVSEIEGAITGEKPLSAEEIRKIIREEIGEKEAPQPVIVTVPAPVEEPKEEKGLTAEDVRAIFSEELDRYLGAEEEPEEEEEGAVSDIVVEEEPEETLTADEVRKIIAEQLAALQKPAEAEKEPEPEPEPENLRDVVRSELAAYREAELAEKKKKEEEERAAQEQQALLDAAREEGAEQARREAEEEAARRAAEAEAEAEAAPEEPEEEMMTADDIRTIVAEEIAKGKAAEEETGKTPEEIAEMIREIIRSTLEENKPVEEEKVAPAAVVVEEPKPEPAPMPTVNIIVKSAPAPEPESEPEPEPEVEGALVEKEEAPAEEPKDKIIRIPFPTRILEADKELKADYNELKSEILSYGVKSRVSNTGDTFRLHKVTFVKITVAGKALKLYFALNPRDYANTTLPIQDAGHKGAYKDIPLVFKVKSDLSLRRAKQLIADVMEKNGLEQGKIEAYNWAADLKDYKPAGSDDEDDE